MRNSMPWSRTSQHQFSIKHSSIGHPKAMVLITSSLICTHSLKSNFSIFSRLRLANKDMKSSAMTFLALFNFKILKKIKNQFYVKCLSRSKILSFPHWLQCENGNFKMTKIDFTANLSGRKILKFPHCVLLTSNCEVLIWNQFQALQCLLQN